MVNLIEDMEKVKLRRSWKIPSSLRNVCCIVIQDDIDLVPSFISKNPHLKIRLLLIPDLPDHGPGRLCLPTSEGTTLIPVRNLLTADALPPWEKVILCRPGPPGAAVVAMLCRYLSLRGVRTVYLDAGQSPGFGLQPAVPDFYHRYEAELRRVHGLLADEASREVYAARIKALMTGDAGYLPLAPHREYYHPLVHPEQGDIMLDGGVSDMVDAQRQFAQSVGENGHIFGFEPIPHMAAVAQKKLAGFPRYHMQNAGLGETSGRVRFTCLRDSSHIAVNSDEEESVLCSVTSVDDFVRKHHLSRIDCLKLDVEGAEMLALAGSRETILKHRPKLIICLYHKPSDMTDVPLCIHDLVPEYTLYVSHSSCVFTDTILYAHIK